MQETQDYTKYFGFTVNLSGGFHMYECVNIVTQNTVMDIGLFSL